MLSALSLSSLRSVVKNYLYVYVFSKFETKAFAVYTKMLFLLVEKLKENLDQETWGYFENFKTVHLQNLWPILWLRKVTNLNMVTSIAFATFLILFTSTRYMGFLKTDQKNSVATQKLFSCIWLSYFDASVCRMIFIA